MRLIPLVFALAALRLFGGESLPPPPALTAPVPTAAGPVVGEVQGNVRVFRGIPYAKPPVGELRWKYTQPPDPWSQPLKCLGFAPICPQPTVPLYGDLGPSSEDCLYLNVWSAAEVTPEGQLAREKLPVLFWIHGGAFAIGAASQKGYDGTPLALEGAIVVTCNYRLGPLGFLAHPALSAETHGSSGNYGLRDIAQALNWTRNNIANFGGDPDNITVWGESAGAAALDALMVSQRDNFFSFQRAIIMSTNTVVPLRFLKKANGALQSAEALGVEFQQRLKIADGPDALRDLRALPPAELLKAARPGSATPGVSTTDNLIVDGLLLRAPIDAEIKAHNLNSIPLLIGNVADEGALFERKLKYDVLKYRDFLKQRFGGNAEAAEAIYPAGTDAEVRSAMSELFADIFIRSTRLHTRALVPLQPDIFAYSFARKAKPMLASGMGVFHGSEVPFFFGTVNDPEKYTDEDRELSRLIRIYLVTFAKTGNPNASPGPRAPDWPPYKEGEERHLILDTPISSGEKLHAKTLDALEKLDARP